MDQLKFTIPEIFSLIGVVQCVYILVYMLFRAGKLSRASIPFLYFLILGIAFFSDVAARYVSEISPHYQIIGVSLWLAGPPLGVLVIVQVAQISKLPDFKYFGLLLLPIIPFIAASGVGKATEECTQLYLCENHINWLIVFGLFCGGFSLLSVWFQKSILAGLYSEKFSKERYWVILSIIVINVFLLFVMLSYMQTDFYDSTFVLARTLLGLSFIYLITTSLFRIYPQSIVLQQQSKNDQLSDSELFLARKIEDLLNLDKVYHEPAYSRSELAKELDVSEMLVSRIINKHFGKTLPQLLNEFRVEDAKRLLKETDANISVIAKEVGFNSMASFNRSFREIVSLSPSEFREKSA